MKPIRRPILHVFLILLLLLYVGNKPATSQTVGIQSTLSSTELISGDSITLTFSTDTAADIYFFSAEIVYDPDQLVFVNAEAAGAMLPDGQIVFNQISPGVLGISVTRTAPLLSPTTDALLQVIYSVKKYPMAGEGGISYSNISFADSQGNDIDFTAPVDAEYSVKKTIVDLSLTTPPSITVTEGESFNATGEIFATGITIDDENTDTLNVWIGVNDEDTDPEGWSEDKWELMTFVDQTRTDYFTYSKDIAYQRPVGLYYVALR
ncbi:MAG TPA: cohesin domain-containing protein, partial [Balneolaceae bacterium]|nr:cohesin domain-containing protein [Balneolaceae bacterium]